MYKLEVLTKKDLEVICASLWENYVESELDEDSDDDDKLTPEEIKRIQRVYEKVNSKPWEKIECEHCKEEHETKDCPYAEVAEALNREIQANFSFSHLKEERQEQSTLAVEEQKQEVQPMTYMEEFVEVEQVDEQVQEDLTMSIQDEISMVMTSDDPIRSLQETKNLKDHYKVESLDSISLNEAKENCMEDAYILEQNTLPSLKFNKKGLRWKKPTFKPPWWKVQKRRKAQSKRVWIRKKNGSLEEMEEKPPDKQGKSHGSCGSAIKSDYLRRYSEQEEEGGHSTLDLTTLKTKDPSKLTSELSRNYVLNVYDKLVVLTSFTDNRESTKESVYQRTRTRKKGEQAQSLKDRLRSRKRKLPKKIDDPGNISIPVIIKNSTYIEAYCNQRVVKRRKGVRDDVLAKEYNLHDSGNFEILDKRDDSNKKEGKRVHEPP